VFHFLPRSWLLMTCGVALLVASMAAQQTPRVAFDASEIVFSVVTGINACGYDQELPASDPLRAQVRAEVARAVQTSDRAKSAFDEMCSFYRDHQQTDSARDLAQYISLALNLGEPPAFVPTVKEADLPPDASYVLGFVPRLQRFYITSDLHQIWERHQSDYNAVIDRFHGQIAKMLLSTDVYLRIPISGGSGRHFAVWVEPMAAPGQVNSRNYGTDYSMVVSPGRSGLRIDPIRHTYLHFVLEPLAARRATTMKRLEPLLDAVKTAPMDEPFKGDMTLLVTESLIRAIEARTAVAGKSKEAETERARRAQKAAEEGFILAPYFEEQLTTFEKSEESLQNAYPDWLYQIDVPREKKRAAGIVFASSATPEAMQATRPRSAALLEDAEKRLAAGDTSRARELAQQALNEKREDPARALFILARISTADGNMQGARTFFERTLEVAHEPRLIAWSHIYLGRICDLQAERDQAVKHYQAALQAGDSNPSTRAAAERGLEKAYEPPVSRERSAPDNQN
jgi:tetratricopeptide (TPR) repeat protein